MANTKGCMRRNCEEKKKPVKKQAPGYNNNNIDNGKLSEAIKSTNDSENYKIYEHQVAVNFFPDIENINLPNIELFSNPDTTPTVSEKRDPEKKYPQIIDLCEEDRLRISQLIEEIARCREINIQDTKMITHLQEEKIKMTIEISKLEKEITQLLMKNEEKGTEILQLERKYFGTLQEQKMQYAELKLRMDVTKKQVEDELKEQKSRNKELVEKIDKINTINARILIKYKTIKKKLKKAIDFIKQGQITLSKNSTSKVTVDKSCQVTQAVSPKVSRDNMNTDSAIIKNNSKNKIHPMISHSKSELSLLSDLFFKGPSCTPNDNEVIVFLPQESNLNCKNKYG